MGVDALMKFTTPLSLSKEDLHRAAGQLVSIVGKEAFMIDKEGKWGEPTHALEFSEEGEIKVNLSGRWYGPGYERGHLPNYILIAQWLEQNLEATVFYGNDSSDDFELFDEINRNVLLEHFLSVGHEPYRGYKIKNQEQPLCEFCGNRPMHDVGGGGGRTFWHCDGCDTRLISEPDKENQIVEKFF